MPHDRRAGLWTRTLRYFGLVEDSVTAPLPRWFTIVSGALFIASALFLALGGLLLPGTGFWGRLQLIGLLVGPAALVGFLLMRPWQALGDVFSGRPRWIRRTFVTAFVAAGVFIGYMAGMITGLLIGLLLASIPFPRSWEIPLTQAASLLALLLSVGVLLVCGRSYRRLRIREPDRRRVDHLVFPSLVAVYGLTSAVMIPIGFEEFLN